jgi:hypothetical protein
VRIGKRVYELSSRKGLPSSKADRLFAAFT